jgi:diadenosine tetraphosphate (Ap4A) HIT family hydrolase
MRAHEMLLASRPCAVAFPDAAPVNPGHCLVIPRRHEPDFFALSREEQDDVWEIVWELRELLEAEHDTTSFNVGINAGEAAGQIVPHAHVHVIPRYPGDVPDPRGGVRWVVPERAPYW